MKSKYLLFATLSLLIASCNDNLLLSESESDVTSSSENIDSSILNSSENDSLPSESEIEESSSIEEESSEEESSSSEEEVILDEQLEALKSIFGEDICYYDETTANPYGVDVTKYGNDVKVVFYDPEEIDLNNNPYYGVDKTSFYKDYSEATSYEDAYYRTMCGLMSGDITPQGHLPVSLEIKEDDKYVRYSTATYVLSTKGEYIAYVENNFDEFNIIYHSGAYTSLNEVAAYLLAFGDVPANSNYHKSKEKELSVSTWGEYGRLNNSRFSGDTSKYPYEPLLPTITTKTFYETDFGTQGNYTVSNEDLNKVYTQEVYNNGRYITRGAARFVYTYDKTVTKIDDRYVFYTYNHYNDFQEYLNYHNGWGLRFGNESAGNGYCYNSSDYYASNKYPVTSYPATIIKEFER